MCGVLREPCVIDMIGGVVTGARQRIDLPAEREDDGMEARDQSDHREQRQQLRDVAADRSRGSHRAAVRPKSPAKKAPCSWPSSGEPIEAFSSMIISAEKISVNMPKIRPFGMSFFGIDGFLGGQRQLLDREEQPHRERQRREHARPAERQEAPPPCGSSIDACRPARRRCSAPSARSPHSGMALIQNTTSTASASSVTTTEILNESSTPHVVQRDEQQVTADPPQRLNIALEFRRCR